MSKNKPKLIVILGPTTSGKTKLAVKLASIFNGEIVSADSRQVYRGMDIGTGKDLGEYEMSFRPQWRNLRSLGYVWDDKHVTKNQDKVKIPYHLIDVVSPRAKFSLARYKKLAYAAIDDIISRGKIPFLVGGTGLYIQTVVDGIPLLDAKPDWMLRKELEKLDKENLLKILRKMDPLINEKMTQGNKRRMIRYIEIMKQCKKPITELWKKQKKESKYNVLIIGINIDRESVNKKIDQRVDNRLEHEGMVEEVLHLREKEDVSWKRLESFGLEYKFISKYLQGELEYDRMAELLKIAIHQFAKRQMTWFKRDKRIKWISGYEEAETITSNFLNYILP